MCGIVVPYVALGSIPTPLKPAQSRLPKSPAMSGPNAMEYPISTHITIARPMVPYDIIIVLSTFFCRTMPP